MFYQSMKHRISVFCACKIYIISLLVYYPVINVEKYSTAARVFYISLMLSNACRAAVLGTLRSRTGARTTADRKLFSHMKHAH